MPISGSLLGIQIVAEMASRGMPGSQYTSIFADAIGNGIVNSLHVGVYSGVSTGLTIGAGVSTGAIVGPATIPATLSGLILAAMIANGMPGSVHTPTFTDALAAAIAAHIGSAVVSGSSTIVAVGAGTGSIIGITGPGMGSLIQAQLVLANMAGSLGHPLISTAIGNAVASAVSSSVVTTNITGVPVGPTPPNFTPVPGVGVDSGIIV